MKVQMLHQCQECGAIGTPEVFDDETLVCTACGTSGGQWEEIPDDMTVELIVARLRLMEGITDGIADQYRTVLDSMKRAKERAERKRDAFLAWAKPLLEAYYLAHPPRGKAKNIDVAGTKLGYRSTAASFELIEGQPIKGSPADTTLHDALKWARANRPELVKVEISLAWADLKASLKDLAPDAELPPGVRRTEAKEEFFVR